MTSDSTVVPPRGLPVDSHTADMGQDIPAGTTDAGSTVGNTGPSDDAIALEFSARHGNDLRYVHAWGKWLRWDACRWTIDDTLRVFDLVRALCRAKEKTVGSRGVRLASSATITAVERLARSDERHARRADDFDADPWLLNTPGGVIGLRTGELRPHCRADSHTKVAGATPGGDCPRWLTISG